MTCANNYDCLIANCNESTQPAIDVPTIFYSFLQ